MQSIGTYPNRIVSLEPSVTATLFALNRQHLLAAVSEHDHRLLGEEALGSLPRVPCTWSVKAKDVLPLNPDLVIASVPFREQSLSELLKAGLDVLALYPERLGSIYGNIRLLAALTDAREEGERVISEMERTFARLRETFSSKPHTRVYMEIWPRPLMNGPAWHVDLVNLVAGEFVPPGPGRQLKEQEILEADPEVIVVAWPGVENQPLEKVYARPGWENVTAIKKGRVVSIPEIWINVPGPNLARGAEMLAEAIWDVKQRVER